MDPITYSAKRDELINILRRVTAISGLSKEKRAAFEFIIKKCLEDQFNIVLVGEFQGGKSTTFNTFCDGREISPRGTLIKTSACRITARNLSDPLAKEFARIYWKSDKDLILNIEDILSQHIDLKKDLHIEFLPGDEVLGLSDLLSFSNPAHLVLIQRAIDAEWENYEENRGAYHPDSLDVLRIATLIVAFANNENILLARGCEVFTIEEVARMIVFPDNWERRWGAGNQAGFAIQEVLFAFIGSIDCFIHSPNLARLGCSITDCPGLFASKWDTQVAIDTIPRADAIIYLLRGDRAIGSEETKALREIKKMPAAQRKLFYAINMKALQHIIDNSIVPHDVSAIKTIGLEVEEDDIKRYHALLAFLAAFGAGYLNKTLEDTSQRVFANMAKRMLGVECSVEAAWTLLTNQQMQVISIAHQPIQSLNEESVMRVRNSSGAVKLFKEVEGFVIKNKAHSILITNGAEKAGQALAEIESTLLNREAEATEDVAKRQAALDEAKNKLSAFQIDARGIVNAAFRDKVYELLISDFQETVIMGSTEEISVKISHQLSKRLNAALGMEMIVQKAKVFIGGKDRSAEMMADISRPIYQQVMKDVISNRAKIWLVAVSKGENNAYLNSIPEEAERVVDLLEERWEELTGMQVSIPRIDYPNIDNVFDKLIDHAAGQNNEVETMDAFYRIAKGQLISAILNYAFSAPFMLAEWIWKEVKKIFGDDPDDDRGGAPAVEKEPGSPAELNFIARKLFPNVKNGIAAAYGEQQNFQDVRGKILEFLKKIGEAFKEECNKALDNQQAIFDADFRISEANLKKSAGERLKVAEEARKMREEDITPCAEAIRQFEESFKNTGVYHETA